MDSIDPIPTTVVRSRTAPPVERLLPVSRERDRPPRERPPTPRREPPADTVEAEIGEDGHAHIDIRA